MQRILRIPLMNTCTKRKNRLHRSRPLIAPTTLSTIAATLKMSGPALSLCLAYRNLSGFPAFYSLNLYKVPKFLDKE